MAESRPRPRPKPRAAAKPATANGPTATSGKGVSSGSKASATASSTVEEDEDAMFMRNRNRTAKAWQKLEKRSKAAGVLEVESGSDDDGTPSPRRNKRKHTTAPSWSNPTRIERLLSADLPSDTDDDEVDSLDDTRTPRATRNVPEKKRICTRPRSVTPPPELSHQQLQGARAIVQQTLNIQPRAESPILIESDDEVEVVTFTNPELAAIVKNAKLRASSQAPPTSSPAPEGVETIIVTVRWRPHPLNEAGKEERWTFKMNRDDNFRDLFDACAEEAQILPDEIVVCYNNRQIYPSVTPIALRIWGTAELMACDTSTYEYTRQNPTGESSHFSLDQAPTPTPQELSDDDDEPLEYGEQDADDDKSETGGDTFKITIRSGGVTEDITVTVRPSTTCGAIVKAFLQKAGLQDQYPRLFNPSTSAPKKNARGKAKEKDPRICIDGDRMNNDTEIGDADLEDGDLVELVGL